MKSYLSLSKKYLLAHARRTRLAVTSVALAVALVVGIFSMLDSMVGYERAQVLRNEGDYHLLFRRLSPDEKALLGSRIDVAASGSLVDLGRGSLGGADCYFAALDEGIARNLNIVLSSGRFATDADELLLERWFMEGTVPPIRLGDRVSATLPDGSSRSLVVRGSYEDLGATKASGIAAAILSMKAAAGLHALGNDFFLRFRDGVDILGAEAGIRASLSIPDSRFARNEALLALGLQTRNSRALRIYAVGAALFLLVLATAVVMIHNAFNISVAERVRQFGLLRCVGASRAQVRRLVRREGLAISALAIPIGNSRGHTHDGRVLGRPAVLRFGTLQGLPLVRPQRAGHPRGSHRRLRHRLGSLPPCRPGRPPRLPPSRRSRARRARAPRGRRGDASSRGSSPRS